jgi:phospholipid/cholesterol/gamma-HCH transport system permease protein
MAAHAEHARRPAARLESDGGVARLALAGDWTLPHLAAAAQALAALPSLAHVTVVDASDLAALDTAGAFSMLHAVRASGTDPRSLRVHGGSESHRRVVEVVLARLEDAMSAPHVAARPGILATLGMRAIFLARDVHGHVGYLGIIAAAFGEVLLRPRRLRARELAAQFDQVCIRAIPVVALVTFLIGVVIAYLLGLQAEQYGAGIFVVDGVAIGMAREFAPLLVSVIVAGRSGAAFTAQLGTMRLTEEIDAIRVLGLSWTEVLVLPRVLALVVAMPLLVFAGEAMGNLGALVMARAMLDMPPAVYLERLGVALTADHFAVGLVKAPVFALAIAVIAIRMGMTVSRDARAIGIHTTSTVVQCIVAVILLDALFAVILQALDI